MEAAPHCVASLGSSSDEARLLEFLKERDAPCPSCGYNLRALPTPVCPECRQPLALTVGVARRPLTWLLIALAPGAFSGIAACFLLIPIVGRLLFGDGRMSATMNTVDLFGWASGIAAILIARRSSRFLSLPMGQQRLWALFIWLVHLVALVLLILVGPRYA